MALIWWQQTRPLGDRWTCRRLVLANGILYLVKSLQGLSTLEFHSPNFDFYFNAGAEFASRAADYDPVTATVQPHARAPAAVSKPVPARVGSRCNGQPHSGYKGP